MTTAHIAVLNAHSIGDTVNMMGYDVLAQEAGTDLYWVLHCSKQLGGRGANLVDGWLHWDLFRFYNGAGIYKYPIYIEGIGSHNYHEIETYRPYYQRYIDFVYSRRYNTYQIGLGGLDGGRMAYNPALLRARFRHLAVDRAGGPPAAPYLSLQPVSTHYYSETASGPIKRICLRNLRRFLTSLPARGITEVVCVGSLGDRLAVARYIEKLEELLPGLHFTNACGQPIESYFKVLYNAAGHCGCESNSAFFAAQVGVPSTIIYAYQSVYDHFSRWCRDVKTLCGELNDMDTFGSWDDFAYPI